jgi:hypothetical protein
MTEGPAEEQRPALSSPRDSYCGLYCGACSVLMAAEEGKSAKVAAEWGTSIEDATCHGCKSGTLAGHCRKCLIRRCAQEKNVDSCGLCHQYPCSQIEAFQLDGWPHHLVTRDALDAIRHGGIPDWLRQQDAQWRCPSCGCRFEFYQSKCPRCDHILTDSRVRAREILVRENLPDKLKKV